jgi:hypothetical protein
MLILSLAVSIQNSEIRFQTKNTYISDGPCQRKRRPDFLGPQPIRLWMATPREEVIGRGEADKPTTYKKLSAAMTSTRPRVTTHDCDV